MSTTPSFNTQYLELALAIDGKPLTSRAASKAKVLSAPLAGLWPQKLRLVRPGE